MFVSRSVICLLVLSSNVYKVGFAFPICFDLITLGMYMELWLGRHAETGETLSANHVFPVGGVTLVVRRRHGYALLQE